jgi:uncharacterized protein YbjQ (UPF0145 family)
MILVTTDSVPAHKVVKYCGLAKGCSVRGLHLGDDLVARVKNAVGGEVHEYTQVFAQCREQALDRMVAEARAMGANAVVGLRFQSAEIGANMAEMMAYGTAVKVEPSGE